MQFVGLNMKGVIEMSENTHIMKNDKLTTVYKKLLMNIDKNIAELEILMDWHILPHRNPFDDKNSELARHIMPLKQRKQEIDRWFKNPMYKMKCSKCHEVHYIKLNDWYRNVRRVGYKKHNMRHYHDYIINVEKQFKQIIMLQHELKHSLKLLWKSK